jgi:aspartate aminotransferase
MQTTNQMNVLSSRINALSESQTLAMTKKARELAAQGHDVISLSVGEPDFQTPQHVKDAAKKAIDDGFHFYSPVPGFPDLRKAIVDKFKRDNNLTFTPEQIVVSTGAKHSIANVLMCLLDPGDEVIIFAPYWVSYVEMVKLAEGVPVIVYGGIENDFKVSAKEVAAAITPRTKAILYSSPCNPTGSIFTKDELTEIAKVVASHENIFIIADEIYEYISFNNDFFSIGSLDIVKDRTITVNGMSKGFAMTGWRLGFIGAPLEIAKACDKMQGQFTSGTCSITQKAAVAALTGDLSAPQEMAKAYLRRRDLVLGLLKEIPGVKTNVPKGAFYIFPDVSYYLGKYNGSQEIKNVDDLCMYLLNNAHVALVPGDAFGDPNCIRISFAASDENLKKAISRIKTELAKLK